jgi:hypothetical protein
VKPKKEPSSASTTDLFGWLDALFTKVRPEGTPPTFMMHRFLASERDFAPVCRALQVEVRDPALVFGVWQALLPKDRGAPRMSYVWPKKGADEEELVTRMKSVLSESRFTCEQMLSLVQLAGKEKALYEEFGFKAPVRG